MIRTVGLLAGAASLSVSGFAGATDVDNASIDALRAELNELRSQNESLEARVDAQDNAWLNETRATEIRGIVQDVLADSQTRTSLQDSNAMGGYKAGEGFFLSSQDGSFTMNIKGQIQVRWVMNHVGDDSGSGPSVASALSAGGANTNQTKWGFQVRRAKVKFQGNVFDKTWHYQVNGAFDTDDFDGGGFAFQEVMITKDINDNLSLTVGQYKAPWTREELVSSSQQLAVERSLVNEYFNADRAVGLDMMYKTDAWSMEVAYNNGVRTAVAPNGGFGNAASPTGRYTNWSDNPTRWAFQGRFQYKISGDWSDFDSFTSSPGDETGIMIGVGGMGQEYNGQLGGYISDGYTVWGITADASAKFGGLSLFASLTWQNFESPEYTTAAATQPATKHNPWGFVGQAGYSLNDEWEIFGRFEWGQTDGANAGNAFAAALHAAGLGPKPGDANAKLALLTIGANYFINTNVKFTVDWGINFNNQLGGAWVNQAQTGWRQTDSSSEWTLRAQLQLLF